MAGAAPPAQAPNQAPTTAAAFPVREVAINQAPLVGGKYESSTPPTLEMLRAWKLAHPGDKQQGMCFDFWRRGFCFRGSTCRYQHQETTCAEFAGLVLAVPERPGLDLDSCLGHLSLLVLETRSRT